MSQKSDNMMEWSGLRGQGFPILDLFPVFLETETVARAHCNLYPVLMMVVPSRRDGDSPCTANEW